MAAQRTLQAFAFDPESDPEAEAREIQQRANRRLQQDTSEW